MQQIVEDGWREVQWVSGFLGDIRYRRWVEE